MSWWMWCLLGFVLLAAELATPGGFYLLFFGIGALIVAALDFFGVAGPVWFQWVLFSALSIVLLMAFRGRLLKHFGAGEKAEVDNLVGERASALEYIEAGATGRVELRGSSWRARNSGESAIPNGQECQVVQVDGLELVVRSR